MKNLLLALLTIVIAAAVAYGTAQNAPAPAAETDAFAHIMQTKVIKAGWFAEPPFTIYDENTGTRSGIVPDIAAQFAKDYGLTIEWQVISDFTMLGEDLHLGKYYVIFASLFNMPRAGRVDAVDPFVFLPTYGYVRADDTRFQKLDDVNAAGVRIAGQEGAAVTDVARSRFGNAEMHIITSANLADMLLAVSTNKADVAFMIPSFYDEFNKNNPGILKPLGNESLQTFAVAFGVRPGEEVLKSMLNNTLQRMLVSGELAAVFKKYDPSGSLLQPRLPY